MLCSVLLLPVLLLPVLLGGASAEPGAIRVQPLAGSPDRIAIRALDVPTRDVLREIGAATGVTLRGVERVPAAARVSLDLADLRVSTAWSLVLGDHDLEARIEANGTVVIAPLPAHAIEIRQLSAQVRESSDGDPAQPARLERIIALAAPAEGYAGTYAGDEIAALVRILQQRDPPDLERVERLNRERLAQIERWDRGDAERASVLANLAALSYRRGEEKAAHDLYGQARDLVASGNDRDSALVHARALASLGDLMAKERTERAIDATERDVASRISRNALADIDKALHQGIDLALVEPAQLVAEACVRMTQLLPEDAVFTPEFTDAFDATSTLQYRIATFYNTTGNLDGLIAIWRCRRDLSDLAFGADSQASREAREEVARFERERAESVTP
jgi:hypothetical protein